MTNTVKTKPNGVKRVLVVEDEGQMSLVLDMVLREKEYEVDYAPDLLTADEYLEKEHPSLILLDNKLPDGYGVDFISYVRKKYPSIPIIMISGFSAARDVALHNGADMFFEKPFPLEEFYQAVDRLAN